MNEQDRLALCAIIFVAGTLLGVVGMTLSRAYEEMAQKKEVRARENFQRDVTRIVSAMINGEVHPRFATMYTGMAEVRAAVDKLKKK